MSQSHQLTFYTGKIGGIIPLVIMVSLMLVLTFYGMGGPRSSWAPGFFALIVGLLLSKNKDHYCQSVLSGIADKTGVVVITAWMFAAVLGGIMKAGGMVEGILWFGLSTGIQGSGFLVIVFLSTVLFAMGTGSSNGANLALAPILFPAGVYLGADPTFVALALLSGAVFGDNIAPISDTTIVGCTTQNADLGQTVRERYPISLLAGVIALMVLVIFGQGEAMAQQQLPDISTMQPEKLFMLLAVVVVVGAALAGRNLIEALSYGIVTAIGVGFFVGAFQVSDLFHIPTERGQPNGLIEQAIGGVTGAVLFVIIILGIIRVFMDSGLMEDVLKVVLKKCSTSVRNTELLMFFSASAASLIVSSNAPSQLLVGPTLVKPLGEEQGISAQRRANIMSAAVCSIFYMMPWTLAVMVWYSAIESSARASGLAVPSSAISFMAPYPWALLGVMLFSIITGWRRNPKNSPALLNINEV